MGTLNRQDYKSAIPQLEGRIDELNSQIESLKESINVLTKLQPTHTKTSSTQYVREWDNGFMEMWFTGEMGTDVTNTISLPKSFGNTDYNVQFGEYSIANVFNTAQPCWVISKTENNFVMHSDIYDGTYWFYVSGFKTE